MLSRAIPCGGGGGKRERNEERERERNVNERKSQKSNFFLGLKIGLESNK